jgi:hypothetical protein
VIALALAPTCGAPANSDEERFRQGYLDVVAALRLRSLAYPYDGGEHGAAGPRTDSSAPSTPARSAVRRT